jgi:L-alanine-DL-glutamate epimerase-like enolase superfamily enzyme
VTASRIAAVEALVLRARERRSTDLDGSVETVVVRIVDEDGRVGIGEADAPAEAVRELVTMEDVHGWSRGLRAVLLGRDPFEIRALTAELYEATIYHGRRGLGIHALSGIDVALHDLVGKQLGRPVYELLGGARRASLAPYATVYAGPVAGRTIGQMMDDIAARSERALALGFRAVKMEVLFEDLVDDSGLVECIREGRRLLGDEVTMMLDFGYRWSDWRAALRVLNRVEDCEIYFAEAVLRHDDLDGHAKLAARVETRVGGAELAATVHECREWLEHGRVDVLQPDINRCGGLSEIRRIAELAELHGALVIPHCWKTGITAAAARHYQAATPNAPWIEVLHPDLFESILRRELAGPEPPLVDGAYPLPREPGLGVELDETAVGRYAVTASTSADQAD